MITPLWQPATVYALGAQVVNAGQRFQCSTAGTSGATGPTGTSTAITDGTAAWDWVAAAWGLTPQGFVSKPLSQVKADVDASLRSRVLGQSAGTEPDGTLPIRSFGGQLVAVITDFSAEFWDLLQGIVASLDPAQATDTLQDALCALTGTVRDPASFSTVVGTCTGVPGTFIATGKAATVTGTLSRFVTTADVTIASATAYSGVAGQSVGDVRQVGGSVYRCTSAGANASGLDGSQRGSGIVDGTTRWLWLGLGSGAVDADFQATVTGPLGANAGTLVTIATPVFGWNGLYNVADAALGALLETSAHLRMKREEELHAEGLSAADAIRAHILTVGAGTAAPVTSCRVFINDTDFTDGNDLPPHSVMVLADYEGADNPTLDQAIAEAVWIAVGGGIATTYGAASPGSTGPGFTASVTDASGTVQTVYWARPQAKPVYVIANVTYDNTPGVFPASEGTGAAAPAPALKGAMQTFGATYDAGRDVRASALVAALFDGPTSTDAGATPVPGVIDAAVLISFSPTPVSSSPLTVTNLQRATFDTANMIVNLTGAAP